MNVFTIQTDERWVIEFVSWQVISPIKTIASAVDVTQLVSKKDVYRVLPTISSTVDNE